MSDAVREAEAFLAAHWSPDVDPVAWRALVIDERWAALRWPSQWFGRDLSDDDAKAVEAVFAAAGAPGPGQDVTNLWAGTMLGYGSDELPTIDLVFKKSSRQGHLGSPNPQASSQLGHVLRQLDR